MRIQDWVGLVAILATVATGGLFIGQLSTEVRVLRARVEAIGPLQRINEARDGAIAELRVAGQAVVSESLRGDAVLERHTWHQSNDNSPKRMLSTSEGICFLTRVSGKFEGEGEWLKVYPENGQWMFAGRSAQAGIQGDARCWRFPWAD